jgi:hypothetical protein
MKNVVLYVWKFFKRVEVEEQQGKPHYLAIIPFIQPVSTDGVGKEEVQHHLLLHIFPLYHHQWIRNSRPVAHAVELLFH